jgi:hypothetical protein
LSRNICVWQLPNHPHCHKPHPPPPLCRSHCPARSRRSFALLSSTMRASNIRRVRQPATMPTCAADPTRYQGRRPDPEEALQPWRHTGDEGAHHELARPWRRSLRALQARP